MDVWNEKVGGWKAFAKTYGREIEFEYWGNSELIERLSKPENKGRLYYWFEKEEFTDEWFVKKLEESIKNLGNRYTPELNFELPIAKIFDGLSRDKYFQELFISHLDDLIRKYKQAISHTKEDSVKDYIDKIKFEITEFIKLCELIDFDNVCIIGQDKFILKLELGSNIIDELIHKFYELEAQSKKEKKEKYPTDKYGWDLEYFRKLSGSINNFIDFFHSFTFKLSNNPFLLLVGEAGIGKSHLLADIATKRAERNQSTILLLGQQFTTTEDPWNQIKKLLQINCDRDTFLAALNSKAESSGARILIFIDAINEGEGKVIWKNYISGFITAVKRFPNLGIVFSLRTSYEKLIIPSSIKENKEAIKVFHYGFANHEYDASKMFFENYNIKQPSIPLLHPEFSNPLFLKLFCEGLKKKKLNEIPDGYEGISTIINFYLDAINDHISEKHNLPTNLQIIQKVVKQIAGKIGESDNSYIKSSDAILFISGLPESILINEKSQFFQDLKSEGLLTENLFWNSDGNHFDGIYISYERFGDHLICSYLLEKYLDKDNPKDSFKEGSRLYKLLQDERTAYFNKGIIDALSIQLPELINLELFEVADHARTFDPLAASFVESLIWRKSDTINEKLKVYINEVVIRKCGYDGYLLNTILMVTSNPKNYFNSDFLHNHLLQFSMSDRDAYWTQFIHHQYPGYSDEVTPIKRMIDWAWTTDKRENISDESIRLMCQTMTWFLASCNRTLRDAATKALICLLEDRIEVLIILLKTFEKVNDPYVLQRIYAVAYGCAIRTNKVELLKKLGDYVFQNIFNVDEVIPDILLRDYAHGIIEYAFFKGHKFDFELTKIRPSFKSHLPAEFPSNEETDRLEFEYDAEGFKDYYRGQNYILSSMVTEYGRGTSNYGDFGRYVFQSALDDWKDLDYNGLSNLAVKWIFEKYGYDIEKHGKFDIKIGSGRHRDNKVEERIGKKYQWIAFYEILAKVSDNCIFNGDRYNDYSESKNYDGPWNPFIRDIDPTVTIKGNPENKFEKFWWNPITYSNWNKPNEDWVLKEDDLPNLIELINVKDDHGVEWLILQVYLQWNEPTPIGEEKYRYPYKQLTCNISSHLVSKKNCRKTINYLKNKDLRTCDLPDNKHRYEMFNREYYWSSANKTFKNRYYGGNEWDEIRTPQRDKIISKVACTCNAYYWEAEFDASKDGTININKPTELLFNILDLQYSKVDGELINNNNEMICFDPSANHRTVSSLLVKKSELIKKLDENNLDIIWNNIGHKYILGGSYNGRLNFSEVIYFDKGKLKCVTHIGGE